MSRSGSRTADVVLHGGNVITMDANRSRASAVAIRDGWIIGVGGEELTAAAEPSTQVIDLRGRTVVPGLIDSHTHLELTTYSRHFWDDVRGLDRQAIVEHVRERAGVTAPGAWIVLQGTFNQDIPDRSELDSATCEHPVAVRWSMHKFQLNSVALAISQIDRATVAPSGIRIHHDESGHPSGLIEEGWDLLNWEPPLAEPLKEGLSETARELFLRHGITTIHEIAASAGGLRALTDLVENTPTLPRFGVALTARPGHQSLVETETFARVGLASGFGSDRIAFRAIKIFLDGGRDGAFRKSDLEDPADRWGLLTRTPQALAREVAQAVDAGVQVWVHAIGDLAQECAVSAIEQATAAHPGMDHRYRIEHFGNELYRPDRLERLVSAGGIPVPNPSFIYAEPDDPDRRLPPRVRKYGIRTLSEMGARPPGNSDTAGAQPFACNPWFVMHCMVNRENKNGLVIDPEEAVGAEEALRAFTVDAARGAFQEGDRGSLEVGKRGDLAVLNEDPLAIHPSRLKEVTSELTMIGGITAHQKESA